MVSAAGPGEGIRVQGGRRSPSRSPPTEPTSLIDSRLSPGPQTENQTRLRSCTGSRPTPSPRTPFRGQGTVTPPRHLLRPASGNAWSRLEVQSPRPCPGALGPGPRRAVEQALPKAAAWTEHAPERERRGARPSPGSSLETSLAPHRPNLEADKVHRSNGHSLSGSRGP